MWKLFKQNSTFSYTHLQVILLWLILCAIMFFGINSVGKLNDVNKWAVTHKSQAFFQIAELT